LYILKVLASIDELSVAETVLNGNIISDVAAGEALSVINEVCS
jgi:hypothetical protein